MLNIFENHYCISYFISFWMFFFNNDLRNNTHWLWFRRPWTHIGLRRMVWRHNMFITWLYSEQPHQPTLTIRRFCGAISSSTVWYAKILLVISRQIRRECSSVANMTDCRLLLLTALVSIVVREGLSAKCNDDVITAIQKLWREKGTPVSLEKQVRAVFITSEAERFLKFLKFQLLQFI